MADTPMDGLIIQAEREVAAVDLRVGPAAGLTVLGSALPVRPNTWIRAGDGQIIWLGPDEWLVTSASARPHKFEEELSRVVSPHDGAAVDVSAQRVSLRLRGENVRELLSFGCSIDLRLSAFPPGACAQTTIARAGVLILVLGDDDYRVFVRPSFAGYLADWLLDAAEEFRTPSIEESAP
ncbi:sarcosine oxidase subunit gamma [Amycolatopsis alkalitolerans]|uniref:Sarcosine oxidase subunit gamma n=1 Tax=Amycolatopsis alkalitolerans TaxID=2547244 RepID=A0A5C4M275_9PSEU|nr:sarcosine oxidase subunit gamma family protein [Amycolatopsis alkalitolerans]TNC25752.1 sarcosine oxidase subunit gamma [Amycolatopsis alkalitolerans]